MKKFSASGTIYEVDKSLFSFDSLDDTQRSIEDDKSVVCTGFEELSISL